MENTQGVEIRYPSPSHKGKANNLFKVRVIFVSPKKIA
jgi:hypothetical protein